MTEQSEGLLGSPAIIPKNGRFLHNQRLGLITDTNAEIIRPFLYYLFNLPNVRGQIRATASGVKVRHTSPDRIYEVQVALPPVSTQRRIAAILSAYDDLIENNTRRIKILEEMAQRIYREWFVHFRFPGHEGVKMRNEVPEGWEKKPLMKLASVNELSIKKGNEPEEINYVDIASVSTGRIEVITPMAFDEAPGRARRIVRHGDIIWSCVRPNRRSYAIIINPLPDLIVSTGFAVITAKGVPYSYLYYALTTDDIVGYLTNHARGAAYPAVTAEDFENATVLCPSDSTLESFHKVVAGFIEQNRILEQKNANLRQTRDLLLPKLVSGEVDVG